MKAKLSIGDVNNVEATLTITMSIYDWRELHKAITSLVGDDKVRVSDLVYYINCLLTSMNKHWDYVADKGL